MRHLPAVLSLLLALAAETPAQAVAGNAVVATRLPGIPATQLLDVDLTTGGVTAFGAFPSDSLPPLAVAVDPVNRDILVALDAPFGSLLLRLTRSGHTFVAARTLARVSGRITDLALARGSAIEVTVDGPLGGVLEVPRNGGLARTVANLPRASAMHVANFGYAFGWVVQSGLAGPPVVEPEITMLDFEGGTALYGPAALPGLPPGITGVVHLPTAVPRAVVSTEAGTLWVVSPLVPPVPQNVTPQLPAGATVALASPRTFEVVALGGNAHPFLKATTAFVVGATWQNLAGPLPGDPVDFAMLRPGARVVSFGPGCPGPQPRLAPGTAALPRLGNAGFGLAFYGQPSSAAVFVLGTSDQQFLGLSLPAPLPVAGGCSLLVSHQVGVGTTPDSSGRALLPLPIPAQPSLAGSIVFAQAFQVTAATLTATGGLAVQIEP